MNSLKNYFFPLLILLAFNCLGQNIITGRVIDKSTKKPVVFAVAFLNNTAIAGHISDDGGFALKNAPAGQYELFVSMVGYATYKTRLIITKSVNLGIIELAPKNDTLNMVTIHAKPKLSPYYIPFLTEFLGKTQFARQCKITNPGVIRFYNTELKGNFSARSDEFINIENNALGYRIKYLLNYFVKDVDGGHTYFLGQSYYEEMKGTPAQEKEWLKNRAECYQGSAMQFLRAVLAGRTWQKGFRILKADVKLNPFYEPNDYDDGGERYIYHINDTTLCEENILRNTSINGLYALTAKSALVIRYAGSDNFSAKGVKLPHVPWIWTSTSGTMIFEQPYVVFDHNGIIDNPASVSFSGYLSEARVANQLPADYQFAPQNSL